MFSPDGTGSPSCARPAGSALMIADADGTNIVQFTPETLGPTLELRARWPVARSPVGTVDRRPERVVVRPVDPAAALTVLDIQLDDSWMELRHRGSQLRPDGPQGESSSWEAGPDGPRGTCVFDLATGEVRTIREQAGDQYLHDVAWLPDGAHHVPQHDTVGDRRVVAADGSGDQAFAAPGVAKFSPFSNDGTRIVAERETQAGRRTLRPVTSGRASADQWRRGARRARVPPRVGHRMPASPGPLGLVTGRFDAHRDRPSRGTEHLSAGGPRYRPGDRAGLGRAGFGHIGLAVRHIGLAAPRAVTVLRSRLDPSSEESPANVERLTAQVPVTHTRT